MDLGNTLASLRTLSGETQREFAKKIGVSNGAVAMWETNKRQPDIDMLKQLATYYDVSVDFLIGTEKSGGNDYSNFQLFDDCFDFKERIRKLMAEQSMSEEDFMRLSGFENDEKNAYLYGNKVPSLEDLIKIAGVLKVSTDYLLDVSRRKQLSPEEELLLQSFERCDDASQQYLIAKANVLSVEGLSSVENEDSQRDSIPGKSLA
ncbi:MAG: helix-turn-helix domain-containing protein [Lachnospiraceae bacterium]